MRDITTEIISNREIAPRYFKMVLKNSYVAECARPGQFVEVRCRDSCEPLLRRPFSIHRCRGGVIELLYRVIGRGTGILSQKKKGETVDLLGPLGNGFTMAAMPGKKVILVAGGIGVAPMLFLAEELAGRGMGIAVFIGARSEADILCEKDFRRIADRVYVATDNGARGFKGPVTGLFKKRLSTCKDLRSASAVFVCGPHEMLKATAGICIREGLYCEVSLEERMACGTGLCRGCVVKTKDKAGHRLVCKDGPAFDARDIVW